MKERTCQQKVLKHHGFWKEANKIFFRKIGFRQKRIIPGTESLLKTSESLFPDSFLKLNSLQTQINK